MLIKTRECLRLSLFLFRQTLFNMSQNVVDIDGAILEGGGQILRIATALSVLLKKPIRIFNIRAGRSNPGLRPQHLAGLNLACEICNGKLIGGELGSTEIVFHPGEIRNGSFVADSGTAGSTVLLFQVSLPCLLFAPGPSELRLKGGTNAEFAPQIDHTLMVFHPIIEKFGVKFDCNIIRRGYYPKGGGDVIIRLMSVSDSMTAAEIVDAGEITKICGYSFVAGVLPIKMAHGMADAAVRTLKKAYPNAFLKIDRVKESPHLAYGNGSGIVIVAESSTECLLGSSELGKKGKTPEQIGDDAAKDLVKDINCGSCVDRYMQDQLILFMALAKGRSRLLCGSMTLHTETAIHITEMLTKVKFEVKKNERAGNCIIECEGMGFCR